MIAAWLGLALAALFFYPLAVALDSDIYYLQWQTADAIETAAALVVLALLLACIIFVAWPRLTRGATAVLMIVAAIPLASFAAGVARELPFGDALREAGETRGLGLGVAVVVLAGTLLGFVIWPAFLARWFRRLLVLISPVSLVVLASLIASTPRTGVLVDVERASSPLVVAERACAPLLVWLFDELSFSYLYDDDGRVRSGLPAFSRLGSNATHYLSVGGPGRETLSALPSFLAARRVRDIRVEDDRLLERLDEGDLAPFSATGGESLFGTARRLGFVTEIAGYYLAYCELLADVVDRCRSLSFYNASSPDEGMFPAGPVLTTLILWPRQFPFGLLKNLPFARHQRALVETLAAFARRPVAAQPPVFRFVHFSVPHLPFVFDADGYDPPFDPLQTASDTEYAQQVQYVDRLLGELVDQLRRDGAYDRTTIVILADHGYRFGGRERDPLHIPFIVKRPGQQQRVDVRSELQGEMLLKDILQGACRPD